jgi:hypothetical protein
MSAGTYVQCDSGQVGWPNGTRWVYEESAGKASEAVSHKTGRQSDKDWSSGVRCGTLVA